MELNNYFNEDFSVDDFINIVMNAPDINEDQNMPPLKKTKSPRRKTFGALINELRDEINNLKLEIELRDAYIFSMLNELKNKK